LSSRKEICALINRWSPAIWTGVQQHPLWTRRSLRQAFYQNLQPGHLRHFSSTQCAGFASAGRLPLLAGSAPANPTCIEWAVDEKPGCVALQA